MRKMTTTKIIQKKGKEKIIMLTAYDALLAGILDKLDIDIILVGDSVGTVLLGYDSTIPVRLENMIYHTACVARVVENSFVVADMPFLSFNIDEKQALINAGRLIQEGGANAVKLEGGKKIISIVKNIVDNGIPVMGHIGLTPQAINKLGGYKVQGKEEEEYKKLLEDAMLLEEAGIFSLVLECVPVQLAKEITEKIKIPTIGIGAGKYCDGQVLVTYDMLGFFEKFKPKFVKRYKNIFNEIIDGVKEFCNEVKEGKFPDDEHSYF
ncbi:MAG TPA: 3-methyl-2-oxobutanoate hydroxymethyltransferase [bacterium]|nr:3-methyl-2-oxobutanoate hydroxymethyltransferase [bacterium]HOL48677.1 3-methyl-2-oxobutanoate hydroxymethyltransferase [bacterium]HPQ19422.1 3-methyl-2-oxobutanoate hydroxymethyltransferase [bacterium]